MRIFTGRNALQGYGCFIKIATRNYSINIMTTRKEEIFWGIKVLDHYDYLLPCHLPRGFGLGRFLFIQWIDNYISR